MIVDEIKSEKVQRVREVTEYCDKNSNLYCLLEITCNDVDVLGRMRKVKF